MNHNLRWVSFLLFIVFLLIPVHLAGKEGRNYSVKYFSLQDGVEDGLVNDIIQDRKGLLWFASWNGLYRFDGYTFKNFKSGSSRDTELSNNRLLTISEDKFGYLWVLSYDSTAYRFNPSDETFRQVCKPVQGFKSIEVLNNGSVWLFREDGSALRTASRPDGTLSSYQHFFRQDKPGNPPRINRVFQDSENQEWILTDNGLYRFADSVLSVIIPATLHHSGAAFYSVNEKDGVLYFGSDKGRLMLYSLVAKKAYHQQLPVTAPVISILNSSSQLFFITDSQGFCVEQDGGDIRLFNDKNLLARKVEDAYTASDEFLWLVHPGSGVSMVDLKTMKFSFYQGKDELGRALTTETGFFTVAGKPGNVWVHPKGGGLSYVDFKTRQLVPFNTTSQPVKWKSNDRCFAAFVDKQGNLWMSTLLNRLIRVNFTPEKFHFYTPYPADAEMPENEIRAVFVDKQNRIWTGSRDNSLTVYDEAFNLLHRFEIPRVYAVTQDVEGNFWISTKGSGLLKATETAPGVFSFQHFTHNPADPYSLSNDNVYYTFQDDRQRIWVATYGGGINMLEQKPGERVRFHHHKNSLKHYPMDRFYKVRHINQDSDGKLWLSTTLGIVFFDGDFNRPESIVFHPIFREQGKENTLSNNDVQMIKFVEDRKVFAITYGGGINELIRTGAYSYTCKSVTQANGLISDIIYSVQQDADGHLWLMTGGGLVKYTNASELVQYPIERIILNMHFSEGVGTTDGKRIFFGTNRGLFYFDPGNIQKSDFVPPLYVSSVWVNNMELSPFKTTDMLKVIPDDINELVLPPDNHSLRIQFSALDMSGTEYIQYRYQLEGFDKEFRYTNTNREANYTNLPPGDYSFRLVSTNNEGVWVDNERILRITVRPTFAETAFARFLLLFGILAVVLLIIYIYTVFYRIKNKARTEEIIADMKVGFFTDVSHELRTPLTLISGPVEYILNNKTISADVEDTLLVVKKNCDRMQNLVSQILDFSKIQDHKMHLRLQYKDCIHFVQHVMSFFNPLADERSIRLTFQSDVPYAYLWFDVDLLEKAIFNLLSNAFKYTPNGKDIAVTVGTDDKEVQIAISDDGVGIPKDKQEQIFNRFENYIPKSNHPSLSSGIGLTLAKELVELHKGVISVSSEPENGSTFFIRLLKGKEHFTEQAEFILSDVSEATPESLQTPADPAPSIDTRDKLLMLIVEDNHELKKFVKEIFTHDFRILEASDGKEGLEKAISFLPDIILTDVMMPGMDGITMLEELRNDERTSHILSIVLSAKTDMETVVKGIGSGADDYIAKPFSVSYLQAKVKGLLDKRTILQHHFWAEKKSETPDETSLPDNEQELSPKDAEFLSKLTEVMTQQLSNPELNVELLVHHFNLSRSNFFHKLKTLTGISPVVYIKEVRMRKAAALILENKYTMAEIAYKVGFSDPHYFSKSFKAYWGVNASEYAKRN
ncbi:MAG: response regulator [Paludibacter sp.]|nr:response regulator [Paludibacter sp.]